MFESASEAVAAASLVPHGACLLWKPGLVWLHVLADAGIVIAYFSIPFALMAFVRKRRDLEYRWMFHMFAAFIVACGLTHAFGVWTLWNPDYLAEGLVKAATALVSLTTAALLWPLIPRALALPSPGRLAVMNAELAREVSERREAEAALRAVRDELEQRVELRTGELRVANERLRQANEELERSNRELEEFAHAASHDLREPLRGINNQAALVLEEYASGLDEGAVERLERLRRLTRRMDALIDSLREYSRVGSAPLAATDVDLDGVVAGVLEDLQVTLEEAGARVEVEGPLPAARCDPTLVAIVFRNLISNAAKYTDRHDPHIEVGWEEDDDGEGGTEIRYYVRDNGIGIGRRHSESIFGIFRRLHGRDAYGGGAGIGLAMAKKIVERHGGWIRADSVEGEGTTFRFTVGPRPD